MSHITQLAPCPNERRNIEVRVNSAYQKKDMARSILGKITTIGKSLDKGVRWKDLVNLDNCVIRLTGFPVKWNKQDFIHGIFVNGALPRLSLLEIIRIPLQDSSKAGSEAHLVYGEVPYYYTNWAESKRPKSFRVSNRRRIFWEFLRPPREYVTEDPCGACSVVHSPAAICQFKILLRTRWLASKVDRPSVPVEAPPTNQELGRLCYSIGSSVKDSYNPPPKITGGVGVGY